MQQQVETVEIASRRQQIQHSKIDAIFKAKGRTQK
jgi:hypothetical protein